MRLREREGEAPEDEVFSLYPVIYVRATLLSEDSRLEIKLKEK